MKKFLSFMMIVFLSFCIFANGNSEKNDGVVTLNWYSHAASLENTQEEIIAKFNETHPDIHIQVIELPEATNDKLQALLIALQSGDDSIDFFNADVTWTATFASAGLIDPLDEYFPEAERAEFVPGMIEAATWDGHIYGFPFRTDVGVLYYRTDLLEKYGKDIPETYEELFATAEEIKNAEGTDLYALVGSLAAGEGMTCNAVEWFYSNGGQVIDDAGNIVINSPENVEILQMMADAYKAGKMPEGVLSYSSGDARASMFHQHQVFMRAWPKDYAMGQDPTQSEIVGNLGVAPLPRGPQGEKGVSVVGGWQLFLNKNSKHKAEAIEFMRFYSSEYAQKLHALNDSYIPARTSIYYDEEVLAKYPWFSFLPDILSDAASRPKTPYYAEISSIISTETQNAMKGSKTAAQALADAQAAMERVGQ